MPKLPAVSARKLIKVLRKKGFELDHSTGSHFIFRHPETNLRVSIPVHQGKDLGRGLTLSILKDAKITQEDFMKLL